MNRQNLIRIAALAAFGSLIVASSGCGILFSLFQNRNSNPECTNPVITKSPTTISDSTGPIAFTVEATGSDAGGTLAFAWARKAHGADDSTYAAVTAEAGHIAIVSTATSSTLTITSATAADDGVYRAVVADDCGQAVSDAASLDKIAPTMSSVHVQSAHVVRVTFSEAVDPGLALTPTNYTLSGSGKGSFGSEPDSIAAVAGDPASFDLTWNAPAEMAIGGDITIAAVNLVDLAQNAIDLGHNSATDEGGAIGVGPAVVSLTSSTADGSYKLGDVVSIQVTFSEAAVVTGTPTLALNSGGTATYSSGSGSTVLTFTYTVGAGQTASDLNATTLTGTIKDASLNPATLTLPASGANHTLAEQKAIEIDTTVPTITDVASNTADGSYKGGDTVSIQVTFSEKVNVTGTPQLSLNSGGTADYTSGTGTNVLTFTYNVGSGQTASDLDATGLTGTIADGALNAAVLTLPASGANHTLAEQKAIVIDTTAPTITDITSNTADGSYKVGDTVSIQLTFSEAVDVSGTPQLSLNSGGSADYVSGAGTATLTFTYTVAGGQTAADLDATALTGTINDAALNAAVLNVPTTGANHTLAEQKAIVIDTTAPTVTDVNSSTADGTYKLGDTVSIQVTFSEPVIVTGTPLLGLSSGGTASYTSGNGTSSLTFTYTVSAGETSADLDATGIAAGTITDIALNAANVTLPTTGANHTLAEHKALVIDGAVPTVVGVSSPNSDGTYAAGSSIFLTVLFSESVTVGTGGGTPQIALNSSGGAVATYNAGLSSGATVVFQYDVQAGDTSADLDYVATSSLTLQGGTIRDAAGNDATLTLATPGAANSLGANKALVIDGIAPTTSVVAGTAGQQFVFIVFSEPVDPTSAQDVNNYLNFTTSQKPVGAVLDTGLDPTGSTVILGFAANLNVADDIRISVGNTILDLAGNAATQSSFSVTP